MDRETALKEFIKNNNIDYTRACDNEDKANYDPGICSLSENIEDWIKTFDDKDKETFLMLLSKYTYLSYEVYLKRIDILIDKLVDKYNADYKDILFVTVEPEDGMKSGSDEIATGIHKVKKEFVNEKQIVKAFKKDKNKDIVKNSKFVVFIDDIIATGFTEYNSIKQFLKTYKRCIAKDAKLILAPLVIAKGGKNYIVRNAKKDNIDIEIVYIDILKSAFRGQHIFDGGEVREKEEIVAKYEKLIDEYKKGDKSYYFGFRESKLLFSTYYDTANNTLCSFWKPTDTHTPLFRRSEAARPDIRKMKRQKKANMNVAYYLKKLKEANKRNNGE